MFGRLEPWVPPGANAAEQEENLLEFATRCMQDRPSRNLPENKAIPAGYTYFAQFVHHDITFDPTSSVRRQSDPDTLRSFRTPRLDLDSIYGAGPDFAPWLYEPSDFGRLLIGTGESSIERDLPRNHRETALIGDPRNDENLFVSQFQVAMLSLHNQVLDVVRDQLPQATRERQFARAQRIVRWFYQYVVWNDLVRRLVHESLHTGSLETVTDQVSATKETTARDARRRFYSWKHAPYIPVEFSAAACYVRHSMIRPGYLINERFGRERRDELPIFADPGSPSSDLSGGRRLPTGHQIQWSLFFDMGPGQTGTPQASRRFDTRLTKPLGQMTAEGINVPLAFLNLRHGCQLELPSGPDVANAMGIPASGRPVIEPGTAEESLWYYILKETTTLGSMSGKMLGPVGGTIVAEVFAGLLAGDSLSFVNLHPLWTPGDDPVLYELLRSRSPVGESWGVADMLVAAGLDEPPPVSPDLTVRPGEVGQSVGSEITA